MFRKTILLSLISSSFVFSIGKLCFADAAGDLQQVESYVRSGQFSQAEPLCKSIAQNNPGSDYALKAQGKLAAIYIMTDRPADANNLADSMMNSFHSNTELPAVLYGAVGRFRQVREFQMAENLSQRICKEFPKSEQAQRIQLDSGKELAIQLINEGRFAQAEEAVNNMVSSAGDNQAMPATLVKIAREFKEVGRNAETGRIYQRIVQSYPNSEFVGKARMGIDKLRIWNLIKAGDVAGAQAALDKLISDYSDSDELPHTVHGIALKFEESGYYQEAKALYEKVKRDYPDDPIAAKITVDVKKCDIRAMVGTSSFSDVSKQIDTLRQSFPDSAHVSLAILRIGEEYYKKALQAEQQSSTEAAKEPYLHTTEVLDIVINQLPMSSATPEACKYAADCYEKLGDYLKANQCYEKTIEGNMSYRLRWYMLFKAGQNYQEMKKAGKLPAEQADSKTRSLYQKLVAEYPDCKVAAFARKWLGR